MDIVDVLDALTLRVDTARDRQNSGPNRAYWIGFESGISMAMDWVETLRRAQIASAKQAEQSTDSRIHRLVCALKRLRAASVRAARLDTGELQGVLRAVDAILLEVESDAQKSKSTR